MKIELSATNDDIKMSYRKMALKYHPDKTRDKFSENKFKEINEAYNTLINEDKRKIYDQEFLLSSASTNTGWLIIIYIIVIIAICSFAVWYISHLSLNI